MEQLPIIELLEKGVVTTVDSRTPEHLLSAYCEMGIPVTVRDNEVSLVEIEDPFIHERINSRLSELEQEYKLEIHRYLDSTNDYLARRYKKGDLPTVCLTEYQTKGHGRRGSPWGSTYGMDLCCSIAWPIPSEYRVTGVASLIIAMSLVTTLEQLGITHVKVKWPNDIYIDGRKIAGILIEQIYVEKTPVLIVGVGLNLIKILDKNSNRGLTSTSIEEQLGACDRNIVAAKVIEGIFGGLKHMTKQLNDAMMLEWQQHDYLRGKKLTIEQGERSHGLYQGIDRHGHLLLQTGDRLSKFSSGHITEISQ